MGYEIKGVPGFDGVYPLDTKEEPLTLRELHLIKKVSGVRSGELEEAGDAGDSDLMVALAVVAMRRAGKVRKEHALQVSDLLMETALGVIRYREDDARPPDEKAKTNGSNESESTTSSSLTSSTTPAAPSAIPLRATGAQG